MKRFVVAAFVALALGGCSNLYDLYESVFDESENPAIDIWAGPDRLAIVGDTIRFAGTARINFYPDDVFRAEPGGDPSANLNVREWDFGDGSPIAGGFTVAHAFSRAGTYGVQFTAGDPWKRQRSDVVSVTVVEPNDPRVAGARVTGTRSVPLTGEWSVGSGGEYPVDMGISRDGNVGAVYVDAHRVDVFDAGGSLLRSIAVPEASDESAVVLSDNGAMVALAYASATQVWQVAGGEARSFAPADGHQFTCAAFDRDGTHIILGESGIEGGSQEGGNRITIRDIAGGSIVREIPLSSYAPAALDVSADSRSIGIVGTNRLGQLEDGSPTWRLRFELRDAATGSRRTDAAFYEGWVGFRPRIALSPDGGSFAIGGGNIEIRNASSGARSSVLRTADMNAKFHVRIRSVSATPDARFVVAGTDNGIEIWRTDGKLVRAFSDLWTTAIAVSPDGRHVRAVVAHNSGIRGAGTRFHTWDLE